MEGAKKLPLITQRFFTPSIDMSSYDYLIFTSKNGVLAAERINPRWKEIPAFAIGEATAKKIVELGGNLFFTSKNSYGDDLAKEIAKLGKKGRYLYLRPKKVVSNLAEVLENARVDLTQIVVYETICQECRNFSPPPKGSVIIFSSPSTVECFFRCFKWDSSYKAIAIGKKTAEVLPAFIEYHISPKPTLTSCVELAKRL